MEKILSGRLIVA